jgi:hypothetical protein
MLEHRDEHGRNWLHVCCGAPAPDARARRNSIRTADVLLDLGIDIDEAAFTERAWRATPLWHTVARGRNLALAEHLLARGCDPNFTLWAAADNNDLDAIRLLVRHGATVDDPADTDTPFLWAVKTSHFEPARVLLELGANVDAVDREGMTALHLMLKKNTDAKWVRMVGDHGARGDIPDPNGRTAAELIERKRAPEYREILTALARSAP